MMTLTNLRLYKIITIAVTFFSFLATSKTYSQETITPASHCRFNGISENSNRPGETESTGTSGTGANIDVLYHKIFWRINPDSAIKYIKGSVQTNFKTIQNNVSSISFDLRSGLIIDSIKFRNLLLPTININHVSNIVTINLGVTLSNNFIDSLIIFYQGTPPAVSGAAQGYQKATTAAAGNYITTLSESYEDRDWWPCKHDMQDKIDSLDITVNVPWATPTAADTFWVASNGKMIDSSINVTNRTFTFKNRYPIASYLVFVSVAKYDRHYRSVNISGTDVQVVYNLLKGKTAATTTNILTAMDRMNLVLLAYSNKIGDYPFKNEKHGYYDGLLGAGGMEHQTFSGIAPNALTSTSTLAHELMHQWFGDNVTFATWNDLWLAEGFANYGEALAAELVPALGQNPYTIRNSIKSSALASTVSAWIPDANIQTSNLIWSSAYGGAVYTRGAMIVSMLRAIAGDTKFFQALTNYQTNLAGKSANADSLKNYFNTILNRDISVFFNDYVGGSGNAATAVGGKGNPINTINWNSPVANKLVVQVAPQLQTTNSNVTYYRGPVVLHVKGALASQDTTLSFFDWGAGNLSYAGNGLGAPISGNLLSYDLSFTPTTVLYDDSARTLSTGSTVFVPTLSVGGFNFSNTIAATATCIAPASMSITLGTNAINGFANPITLSVVSGVPAGANVTFSNNPVTPGGNTIVTLNNTNSLPSGSYNINLQGAATGAANQTATISFVINPGASPAITTPPISQTVCEGANVTFTITAATATNFQWQVSTNGGTSWANVTGSTSATLILSAVTNTLNGNQYRCQASTLCGASNSTGATLTVNTGINITTQPANATICAGQTNTFCVTATGSNVLYQWQTNPIGCTGPWTNIASATSSCLTLNNVLATAYYRCVVSSSSCAGSITTSCATLTVNSGVIISTQPTDAENCAGTQASFTVAGTSAQTINYQWQVSTNNGTSFSNISGANNASYTATNLTTSASNNHYRCLLTNASCSTPTISNAAILTVKQLPTIALSAAPFTTLSPSQTTIITATIVSSNAGITTTNWFYNTAPLSVTANTYPVAINQVGDYYATIKETFPSGLQCSNTSATITITASESDKLFIFPTPNNGTFNVSYYNSSNTNTKRNISIYDTKGAVVYKKEFAITGFYTLLPVNLQAASRGDYFVVIFDAEGKKLAVGKVQVK
jgi:Peptidase family M1 domain/Secretion system C-terminal sorting domain